MAKIFTIGNTAKERMVVELKDKFVNLYGTTTVVSTTQPQSTFENNLQVGSALRIYPKATTTKFESDNAIGSDPLLILKPNGKSLAGITIGNILSSNVFTPVAYMELDTSQPSAGDNVLLVRKIEVNIE